MKLLTAILMLLAAYSLSAAQQASSKDAEENRILALENAWNQAEEHKDGRALDALLASTLIYIDYDGSLMNKGEFLASIQKPSLHPEQIVNESMNVNMYGNIGIVTGIYREKGVSNGKPYLRRGRFTDTWINLNNTWQCVASQSTLISQTNH